MAQSKETLPAEPAAQPPVAPLAGRRILLVGPALAATAGAALKDSATETVGLERLAGARAGAYDLVLADADAFDADSLGAALQALERAGGAPPVLLIGQRLPAAVVRNLMRLERSDVLEAPFVAGALTAAAAALLTVQAPAPAAAPATPVAESRCWAVTGAVGGAGATMLAVEIASALAQRADKDRSVCLIDLNFADGAAAAYLGLQPSMRLADFNSAAERIDADVLHAFVSPVSKQLDVLACPRDPDAFETISREVVLRVLEVACEAYAHVVLDLPRHRRTWTLEALAGSDEVLVVSELTVPALIAARSLAEEIEAATSPPAQPRIILNRLAARMFGPAPSMAEAERALQRKADAGISSDWEAAAAAANLGGSIAQHRPKSKIVKDVAQLVERLAQAPRKETAAPRQAA
jgi:pilus assembly protein CpaE